MVGKEGGRVDRDIVDSIIALPMSIHEFKRGRAEEAVRGGVYLVVKFKN